METLVLNNPEVRVLGCLLEKEATTPDYYPLTLNALTAACNQKSSRNPVVDYSEKEVLRTLDSLREKKLASMISTAGGRVPKYSHRITGVLDITEPQQALLCLLLLRGAQTVGELRTRCGRIYDFESLEAVEATLEELAALEEPLVTKLPRRAGQKECRYAHLLSGEPDLEEEDLAVPAESARQALEEENQRLANLEADMADLRAELANLRQELATFRRQFD